MELLSVLIIIGLGIIIGMISKFKSATTQNFRVINKKIIDLKAEFGGIKSEEVLKSSVKAEEKKLRVDGQKLTTSLNPIEKTKEEKAEIALEQEISAEEKAPLIVPIAETIRKSDVIEKKQPKELEKVIGENLLNKIGIGILVLGLGFFVKYAIDQNWIGEIGRVLIGLAAGGILIGIAHFLRKKYSAFSSVLIGGALSTFYYTITIAYQYYGMFSQTTGFILVTIITVLGVALAMFYDKKELAIIALIGAFTAPFMVSGDAANMTVFFTYIAVINSGLLALSFAKNWRVLTYLSFGFTLMYFGGWIGLTALQNDFNLEYQIIGIVFASIYFVQFLGMILAFNLLKRINFNAFQIISFLTVSGFYFGVMMLVLETIQAGKFQGGFTLGLSIFFLALAAIFRKRADKQLTNTLLGKGILFATLSVLILFSGDYTTIFWSLEAILLIWLAKSSTNKLYRNAGIFIHVLAFVSLLIDWIQAYWMGDVSYIGGLSTTLFSGIVLAGSFLGAKYLISNDQNLKENAAAVQSSLFYVVASTFLLYFVGLFEINLQQGAFYVASQHTFVLWTYHALFIAGIVIWNAKVKRSFMVEISFFAGVIFLLCFITLGENYFDHLRFHSFNGGMRATLFNYHYIITGVVILIMAFLLKLGSRIFETENSKHYFNCVVSLIGLALFCRELDQLIAGTMATNLTSSEIALQHIHVAGYTLAWGVFAFLIMVLGLKKEIRIMRIFALIAFAATLLKLFCYDILNISVGGKIVAFISLGVILLIVSFLYQKLKQLIVDGSQQG